MREVWFLKLSNLTILLNKAPQTGIGSFSLQDVQLGDLLKLYVRHRFRNSRRSLNLVSRINSRMVKRSGPGSFQVTCSVR